jgi:hypothetical protein
MTKKKAAKKKTAKKTGTKSPAKRGRKKAEHVAMFVRVRPEAKEWLEETARHHGMSRDGFVRLLFDTARAMWDEQDEERQLQMFETLGDSMEDVVGRAIERAVENAITKTPRSTVEKKMGRMTRPKT